MSRGNQLELLQALMRVYNNVSTLLNAFDARRSPDDLDLIIYLTNKLYRIARLLDASTQDTLEAIGRSLSVFEELQQQLMDAAPRAAYEPGLITTGSVGRPRLDVRKDQLEYLLGVGFSTPQIATTIGVSLSSSLSTVRRRMTEYGLSVGALYSDIPDQELDSIVNQIKVFFPNCGYRLMGGHLLCQGYRLSQARIKESLNRVDPEGIAIRWSVAIERRRYRVQSPLSLWHLDGNHKLVRWRMVIHGAVDGFSRIPVYLKCSDNNLAQTVLTLFKEAVQQYGLPSRVRCDRGVENVDVSFFLLSHPLRGPGRGSVLVGKSVHNQRVERMWRDVYQGVTGLYHSLFYHLENINLFNPDNELHLFCLHYVFIPRINRHLQLWSSAWIKHPMRSEHNLTPEQLWTSGLQSIANCGSTVSKEVFEQLTEEDMPIFGIDWDGPMPPYLHDDDSSAVVIPATGCPLDSLDFEELCDAVCPLADSANYGIDLYEKTLDFVSSKLGTVL